MSSVWMIRRSASDVKVAGVCGGVARHWGVDPVLIRVGWALLALSGGVGVVLYLAGWLLIPREDRPEPAIFDVFGASARRWPREAWVVLVAVCCLLAFTVLGALTPFGFGPAVILALIWYFGYYKSRPTRRPPASPAPPGLPGAAGNPDNVVPPATPFTQAAYAWQQRIEQVHTSRSGGVPVDPVTPWSADREATYEPAGPASALPPGQPWGGAPGAYVGSVSPDPIALYQPPPVAVAVSRPTRRGASRSARRLRLVALVAVALAWAALGVAEALGRAVPLAGYFAAALLVLGLSLVAASWYGRARGLLPVALLVCLATLVTTLGGPVARAQGWGSEHRSYTSAAQLVTGDQRKLGVLQVDLRSLTLGSDPVTYAAHVGVGAIAVTVPQDANVVINWRVKAGALVVNGAEVRSGSGLHDVSRLAGRNPGSRSLVLDLSVDQGIIRVTQ